MRRERWRAAARRRPRRPLPSQPASQAAMQAGSRRRAARLWHIQQLKSDKASLAVVGRGVLPQAQVAQARALAVAAAVRPGLRGTQSGARGGPDGSRPRASVGSVDRCGAALAWRCRARPAGCLLPPERWVMSNAAAHHVNHQGFHALHLVQLLQLVCVRAHGHAAGGRRRREGKGQLLEREAGGLCAAAWPRQQWHGAPERMPSMPLAGSALAAPPLIPSPDGDDAQPHAVALPAPPQAVLGIRGVLAVGALPHQLVRACLRGEGRVCVCV